MASRPLQIAFTALTLSLVVSLSLWVLHASYEQIRFSRAVTLQMPSAPAEINSHEVRDDLRLDPSTAQPFIESNTQPQVVELGNLPKLEGIEAAPVSQNSPVAESPSPFPTNDGLPELSFEPPAKNPTIAEEPLELPELSLSEPDDEESLELPQLDPNGNDSAVEEPLEPPLIELMVEPLSAPRPPAWISAQATLEAEIKQLQRQQKNMEEALTDQQQLVKDWIELQQLWSEQRQAWDAEKQELIQQLMTVQKQESESRTENESLQKQLEISLQEAADSRKQFGQIESLLEESHTVNAELKNTLKQKLSIISTLENDARKARYQLEEQRTKRGAIPDVSQSLPPRDDALAQIPASESQLALLPPLPDETSATDQIGVLSEEPIVSAGIDHSQPSTGVEEPVYSESVLPRTPLIPAEVVGLSQSCQCPTCSALRAEEPQRRGLVYDLKDWYHGWRETKDSYIAYEPLGSEGGRYLQAKDRSAEKIGLVPELVRWWDHRVDEWN